MYFPFNLYFSISHLKLMNNASAPEDTRICENQGKIQIKKIKSVYKM